MNVLHKRSELRYALHLGSVSREQCIGLIPTYNQQVKNTKKRLSNWHKINAKRLSIETYEFRRARKGLGKIIYFIPSLVKEGLKYRSIPKNMANMIVA